MRCAFLLAAGLALSPAISAAATPAPWVAIMSPADGVPAIGELEVRAIAGPEDVVTVVEVVLDGQPVSSLSRPPYRFQLDLGGDNREHLIEVVARNAEGEEARAAITTRPIPIAAEFEVELRQLYVTVTRDGSRVPELDRDLFSIEDDGEAQRIVTFAGGEVPFTASILIDSSASMRGEKLDAAIAGARAFIDRMRPLDQVQLSVFSDRLAIHTPIGAGREVMLSGLGWARAEGGTAALDHLWAALRLLEARQGRRVVVLLSDGLDSHSVLPVAAVVDAARRSQALVYWVRIERPGAGDHGRLSSAWRSPSGHAEVRAGLEQIALESGGRIVPVAAATEVEPVLVAILEELREQYVLGYYPSERRHDGSWRRVAVRVEGEGLEVRTTRGYVDD